MFATLRYCDRNGGKGAPDNVDGVTVQMRPAQATSGSFPPHLACENCRAKKVGLIQSLLADGEAIALLIVQSLDAMVRDLRAKGVEPQVMHVTILQKDEGEIRLGPPMETRS
jgi:hypothetical protein